MRTKIAVSTIGLLTTLAGCGGGDAPTGQGGSAAATSTGVAGPGGSAAMGTGGSNPNPGGASFGAACVKNGDCASLLCVDIDAGHAVCTKPCADDAACPPAPQWSCATKGGSQEVCLCQPSGVEICDGQDNDCDGVVDGGDCPELFVTSANPIGDFKLTSDKLIFVTDKTIEKVDLAAGAPVVLRADVTGVQALAVDATSIYWIQGTFRQMDFVGNTAPEKPAANAPPVTRLLLQPTYSFYLHAGGIHRTMDAINKGWVGGAISDMALANDVLYWFKADQISYVSAIGPTSGGTLTIASTQPGPSLLAFGGGSLYWSSSNASIHKAAPPAYVAAEVITGEPGITGLATDATNLYWANGDGMTSTLWKLPLAGGTKTKLGVVNGVARHLAPAGKQLYFETGKLIWRSPT